MKKRIAKKIVNNARRYTFEQLRRALKKCHLTVGAHGFVAGDIIQNMHLVELQNPIAVDISVNISGLKPPHDVYNGVRQITEVTKETFTFT